MQKFKEYPRVLKPGRLQKTDSSKTDSSNVSFLYPIPWAQSRTTLIMCENAGKCITEFHCKWLDFGGGSGSEENVKI